METIRLVGQTEFDNGRYEMSHKETILIETNRVQSTIAGFGTGCEVVDPVSSDDPAVIEYERRKVRAREISAYRNRPITPIFKPERRKAKPRPPIVPSVAMPCPVCHGDEAIMPNCDVCNGLGEVLTDESF